MAVYEDNSFTKVADTDYEVAVPDHVNVGVSGNNLGGTGYTVVAKNCWVTPDDDVNNPIKYDALIDGCPNPDVSSNSVHRNCLYKISIENLLIIYYSGC